PINPDKITMKTKTARLIDRMHHLCEAAPRTALVRSQQILSDILACATHHLPSEQSILQSLHSAVDGPLPAQVQVARPGPGRLPRTQQLALPVIAFSEVLPPRSMPIRRRT